MRTSRWFVVVVVAAVAAGACSRTAASSRAGVASTAAPVSPPGNPCSVQLQGSDLGVTPTDITVEVMTDVGSPLTGAEDQGVIDAINAFLRHALVEADGLEAGGGREGVEGPHEPVVVVGQQGRGGDVHVAVQQ
jgi:hypothetical protein